MNAFERDRTLVVVDMQDHFLDRCMCEDLVPVICGLIQHARQNKWAIILLQYEHTGCRPIHQKILESVKDYPHTDTVAKYTGDGGEQVLDCINEHPSWPLSIVVCGVYGGDCVSDTVAGLLDLSDLVEIDVVTDAVHPNYISTSEVDALDQIRECLVTMDDLGVPISREVVGE